MTARFNCFELYDTNHDDKRIGVFDWTTAGKRRCVAKYRRFQKKNPDAILKIVDRHNKNPRHYYIKDGEMYATLFQTDGFFYHEWDTVCVGSIRGWIARDPSPDSANKAIIMEDFCEDD